MASSRLELISKKLIKPSICTPPPIRNYKLSITDQLMNNVYMPLALFYPNKSSKSSSSSPINNEVSALLENSLSKLLASYYPFAGRLVLNNSNIDCNDMGATFIEARAHCKISEISRNSDANAQDIVFPSDFPWRTKHDQSLLLAQLTHFDCGGKALSVCMSHKVGDGYALCCLLRDWAAITRSPDDDESLLSPKLNVASMFPPSEEPPIKPESSLLLRRLEENIINKRYVFDSKKLSELRAKASADTGIQNPTRVEVITAFLYKCANAATSLVHPNSYKPQVFWQPINIRPLIDPQLSSNSLGNLVNHLIVPLPDGMKDLSFSKVVSELRRAKVEFYEKMKGVAANELNEYVINNSTDFVRIHEYEESDFEVYTSTSVCRFPYYDTDFGWGKPESISFGVFPFKNVVVLMDGRSADRVETQISLEDQVMETFERDPQLLHFASTTSNKL